MLQDSSSLQITTLDLLNENFYAVHLRLPRENTGSLYEKIVPSINLQNFFC